MSDMHHLGRRRKIEKKMLTGERVEKLFKSAIENAFQLPHGNPFLIFHGCSAARKSKQTRERALKVEKVGGWTTDYEMHVHSVRHT